MEMEILRLLGMLIWIGAFIFIVPETVASLVDAIISIFDKDTIWE